MKQDTMEIGRTAEKIVEDLFEEAGFEVIPYGYEYLLPKLANKNNLIKGMAADYIRHQPDFIVINKKNEAVFVEVKFRKTAQIKKEHLFDYPKTYLIFLTPRYIYSQNLSDLREKKEKLVYLNEVEPFKEIPPKLIWKYVKKVRRLLGQETLKGQILEEFIETHVGKRFQQPKEIEPEIIGLDETAFGWERLEEIPNWVIKKSKTSRARRVWKVGKEVSGEHYNYRIIKGRDEVLRGYRKKKFHKRGKNNIISQKRRYRERNGFGFWGQRF